MVSQRDTLKLQYELRRQVASDLEAQYAALDSQARDLKGQIQYKTQQRNDKTAELLQLEAQYRKLQPADKAKAK